MGRTGFGWLRIGSSGGVLWTWWWTFGFHKENKLFDKLSDYRHFKDYPVPWIKYINWSV
jgi:hypothetical protein